MLAGGAPSRGCCLLRSWASCPVDPDLLCSSGWCRWLSCVVGGWSLGLGGLVGSLSVSSSRRSSSFALIHRCSHGSNHTPVCLQTSLLQSGEAEPQEQREQRDPQDLTTRYADQWRWIMFDLWDFPWDKDNQGTSNYVAVSVSQYQSRASPS